MADIVDADTRSRMMAAIRGKNTRPEWVIRSALHRAGYRFRLHDRRLPGAPDLVLRQYRTVIFVHGCFWHRHSGCKYATTPASRAGFWQEKFRANVERDRLNCQRLCSQGWRVLVVWECGIKHDPGSVVMELSDAIRYGEQAWREIPDAPPKASV